MYFNNRHSNKKMLFCSISFRNQKPQKKSQINLVLAFVLLQFNHILIDGYIWVRNF
jgi:hypothetical protein